MKDYYVKNRWIFESIGNHRQWVHDIVQQIKPKTFLELGTGIGDGYAKFICEAMAENETEGQIFISYEICKESFAVAEGVLNQYESFTKLHCDDMFNFFDDYKEIIPDMYLFDAGDERLYSDENPWSIYQEEYISPTRPGWKNDGKYYGEGSHFEKKISENLDLFLKIQNNRSKTGTYVLLDDFFVGRGQYIAEYIVQNKEEFDSIWNFISIVKDEATASSLALIQKK